MMPTIAIRLNKDIPSSFVSSQSTHMKSHWEKFDIHLAGACRLNIPLTNAQSLLTPPCYTANN